MFKKALLRGLLGFPLGVFLSYSITIVISMFLGGQYYSPVVPSFADAAGGELNAVILQYVLSGLLGMGFAGGSVVWENESWSLFRRTATHLLISVGFMFPVAYANHWMPRTPLGIVAYILIFVAIYAVIWGAQWVFWMRRVREINTRLGGR